MSNVGIRSVFRRVAFGLLFVMVTLFSMVAPLLTANVGAAGGESYAWSPNNTTYTISGNGDVFGGGVSFTAPKPTVPAQNLTFRLTGNFAFNKNGVNCMVMQSSGLGALTIQVGAGSPGTGRINFPADIPSQHGTGGNSCANATNTWNAVHDYFNNVQITIGGTAPFDGAAAQQVNVTALPGQGLANIPPTATFTIKSGSGSTLAQTLALPSVATATGNYNNSPAAGALGYGPVVFTLQPGPYSACAEWGVGSACQSFTKAAEPVVIQLKDLQSQVTSRVQIRMCFAADAATPYTLGPYSIALQTSDGTRTLISAKTDSRDVKPVAGSNNADSRICIPAFIDDLNSGTGLIGDLVSTSPEINTQVNANPGGFKVCIIALNLCKPYAPSLIFILSDIQGAALMSESQKQNERAPDATACDLAFNAAGERSPAWFACPVHEALNFTVGQIDNLINNNLKPDLTIFDKGGNGASYHGAWNSFRVIALGLIVIAALIMVISQATGLGILDAYTTQKLVPRLLFAAVFVSISWDLIEVFYRLCDAATFGIRSLIYAPFSALKPIELGGGSAFTSLLLSSGALIAMGWMALLSFALSALLATGLAFLILILMKIGLTAVLIVSPLFIAAAILPGTNKLYQFGKGALISLLLAPVVVGAIIALFRVAAVIAYNRADGYAAINQIIAILLYFGAYFAILKGLSAMGGVAAAITGAVGDRGRGAFNQLKQYRSNTMKERRGLMKTGSLYKGNNPLARGINATTQRVANGGFGITPSSQRRYRAKVDLRSRGAAEHAMKSEAMQQLQYDDDGIAAMFLSGGKSSRRARSELRRLHTSTDAQGNVTWHSGWNEDRVNQAVSTAEAVGINKNNAIAAGTLAAQNKFRSLAGGQAGIDAIDATSRYIAGGDHQLAENMEEEIKVIARKSGRSDLAGHSNGTDPFSGIDGAWGKTNMAELNGSAPVAMKAHLENISHRIRTGRQAEIRTQWQDAQGNWRRDANGQLYSQQRLDQEVERQKRLAAVQLVEAHTIMKQGTNADNQAVINQELTALGYDTAMRASNVSIEGFAAHLAGATNPGSGQAIRSLARTWEAATHPGYQNVPVVVPGPMPPVPIKRGGATRMGVNGRRPPTGPQAP